jgi:hypothetical protein
MRDKIVAERAAGARLDEPAKRHRVSVLTITRIVRELRLSS